MIQDKFKEFKKILKQLTLWNIEYNSGDYLSITVNKETADASNEYWNKIDDGRFDFFCYISSLMEDKSLED